MPSADSRRRPGSRLAARDLRIPGRSGVGSTSDERTLAQPKLITSGLLEVERVAPRQSRQGIVRDLGVGCAKVGCRSVSYLREVGNRKSSIRGIERLFQQFQPCEESNRLALTEPRDESGFALGSGRPPRSSITIASLTA
jgi:hypothetical protein